MFLRKQTHMFDYFICYHLESGLHVIRPNQGLSLGREKSPRLRFSIFCYFLSISKVHNYSTRLSSTHAYALPKARTNYGKFRIKFIGAKVLNALDADLKTLSFRTFKARLKENFTLNY